jgi:signal transduction histidine kinase
MSPTGPGSRALSRGGLRFRVFMLVGLGVVGPGALLTWAFLSRLAELDEKIVSGRLYAAAAVAGQLDAELLQSLEGLQRAASAPHVDLEDEDPEPERAALRDSWLHNLFPGGVFILDAKGRLLEEEPRRGERSIAPAADSPEVLRVLQAGRPAISGQLDRGSGAHVYAMVPVRNWQGRVSGIVGGVVDVTQRHYSRMLYSLRRTAEGYAEVVDSAGIVLASSTPEHQRRPTECRGVIKFVGEQRGRAGSCLDCHPRQSGDRWDAVFAVAPLSVAPWGLVLRVPRKDLLASAGALPVSLVLVGIVMLGLGAVFAWGAARSVTQPLAALTHAAEGIAGGNLTQPIPQAGEDEVGRLASALEGMRSSLARTNQELETRVAERTRELNDVNEKLRQREQSLARLYQKVIAAQEEERKRIARELHDETSQSLAVLVMGLESASTAVKAGLTPRLDEVKALAVHTIEEIHRLIFDLRPSVLDDLGLYSAIRWYAERYLMSRGISVRCEFDKLERRLPQAFETAIFRVCQEAMNNVLKHAEAETVLIQVAITGEALHIEIEDDGKGFDPSRTGTDAKRPSFGLAGIRERVDLLGGEVQMDAAPGQGTRIRIDVPLPSES